MKRTNRRIAVAEAFLATDAILELYINITGGLVVYDKVVRRRVMEKLPFMATENIMMEAVKRGGNRQELHEIIRKCSMEATAKMKNGEDCDLLERLSQAPEFGMTLEEMRTLLNPSDYIGRCPEQVESYLAQVKPALEGVGTDIAEINL